MDSPDSTLEAARIESGAVAPAAGIPRISSRDLLGQLREIEISHEGRIYRLRLTQSNKLILTA
ncbi:MAG: hypothetical protein JWP36_1645 [Paucimonas sp.]|nr:hypothetical protein [Paucimonas sp.]